MRPTPRRLVFVLAGALVLAGTACGGSDRTPPPRAPAFLEAAYAFTQLSFVLGHLDGAGTPAVDLESNFTAWGECELSFVAAPGVLYMNLFVRNGTVEDWVIRDLPLLSRPVEPTGTPQVVSVTFDLVSVPNWPVNEVWYAATLSDIPTERMPDDLRLAEVAPQLVQWCSGEVGYVPDLADWPRPRVAATPTGEVPRFEAVTTAFPNQEQAFGEGVATAVSNSLAFLNAVHALGLTEAQVGVDAVKPAVGWTNEGASVDPVPWWDEKATVLDEAPYGIRTTVLADDGTAAGRIAHFDAVADAIAEGQGVELRVPGHAACVVALAKQVSGPEVLYVLHLAHDTDQGDETRGTKVEPVHYDPVANRFAGGWLFDGVAYDRVVIQAPARGE